MSGRPWSLAEDAAVLLGPPYWPVAKCAGRSLAAVHIGAKGTPAAGYERGVCWLFSSMHRAVCETYARTCGWTVET